MKTILLFILMTLVTSAGFAQQGWYLQPSFTSYNLYDCKATALNNLYIASDLGTIFRSSNGGHNWTIHNFNDPLLNNNSFKYILGQSNDNWTAVGQQAGYAYFYAPYDSVLRVTATSPQPGLEAVSAISGYFFYTASVVAGQGGNFYIRDASNNWQWRKDTAATRVAAGRNINYSWGNFFVGDNGLIMYADSVGFTHSNGEAIKWKIIPSGTTKNLHSIIGGGGWANYVAVGDDGTIIRSTDYGQTWYPATSQTTEDLYGCWLGYAYLACGANGTILRSTDAGLNVWVRQNSPTTNDLYSIVSLGYWEYIAMGETGTILRTTNGGVGINQISTEAYNYTLSQNYPNPFNPETKIRFSIPSNPKHQITNVKLVIYNSLGKEVETLVDEQLSAGSYEVDFSGKDNSTGVYFYKLKTEYFEEVKQMMLIK